MLWYHTVDGWLVAINVSPLRRYLLLILYYDAVYRTNPDGVVAAKTGHEAAALRPNNDGGCTGDATIAGHADAACECCRRKDEEHVDGSMDIVDQARSEVGAASSLAPKPPSGPTGFSNPAGASAPVAQQALGTKVRLFCDDGHQLLLLFTCEFRYCALRVLLLLS